MLKDKLEPFRLILASQSPRRQMLLKGLDLNFEVITFKDVDESFPDSLQESDVAIFLAKQKANAYRGIINKQTIIITADTIVWHNNRVLNKPCTRNEAIQMLSELSGNMHVVYTGVCITGDSKQCAFYSETKVWFADLSEDEIAYYVDQYKPYDKAGAYGAQEWVGYVAIKKIEGSYFNVMGLPVRQLYSELESFVQ